MEAGEQGHLFLFVGEAHQEVPQSKDPLSAPERGGASVIVTLMYADTGAVLQIGHLCGHTVMVAGLIETDMQATEDPLGVIEVPQEEELLPGSEAEGVGATVIVCPVVQYVTAVVTAAAQFAAGLLWTGIGDHHVLRGSVHLLRAEADQHHVLLVTRNLLSGLARRSRGPLLGAPQGRPVWFPMMMAHLTQDGIERIALGYRCKK